MRRPRLARKFAAAINGSTRIETVAEAGHLAYLDQPEAVARAALVLLEDDRARAVQRAALLEARAQLGEPGAGLRAARAVLREASGGGAP